MKSVSKEEYDKAVNYLIEFLPDYLEFKPKIKHIFEILKYIYNDGFTEPVNIEYIDGDISLLFVKDDRELQFIISINKDTKYLCRDYNIELKDNDIVAESGNVEYNYLENLSNWLLKGSYFFNKEVGFSDKTYYIKGDYVAE